MEELPFTGPGFTSIWQEWLEYRRQRKLPKYVPVGLKRTFTMLKKISENNEETAIKMIDRAISNNWQGFNFKLPENYGINQQSTGQPKSGTSEARIIALRQWGTNTGNGAHVPKAGR